MRGGFGVEKPLDGIPARKSWAPAAIAAVALGLALTGYVLATRGASRVGVTPVEQPTAAAWADVTPAQANAMLKRGDYFLLNVHVPYAGELPGTDAFIPYDAVRDNLSRLPSDRSLPIIVYCRSGRMSALAAETLTSLGYRRVYNLRGGMEAWVQAGYPLLRR